METIYERVAGLHQATVVGCVRVMEGRQAVRDCRTFATTTDGLLALLIWLEESRCGRPCVCCNLASRFSGVPDA